MTAAYALCVGALSGCAAITNPVADGVPVRRLPEQFLGEAREEQETIPLTLLRQRPPKHYALGPGDVLGIWIEGVLGRQDEPPPVTRYETTGNLPPAVGTPIVVRETGTISLPLLEDPITVQGMSITECEDAIRRAYTSRQQLIQPEKAKIIVTLVRPRLYHVLVIRQDTGGVTLNQGGILGGTKRGTGFILDLPAYENDVLNALAKTGGLPGVDAANEVIIQRGYFDPKLLQDAKGAADFLTNLQSGTYCPPAVIGGDQTADNRLERVGGKLIRIPLRMRPDQTPDFDPEDVILESGDIIFIEARDTEVFYTGGLLPIGEHIMPRDYDLDIVEAIARVGGPIVNGGFNARNFATGTVVSGGIGNPSPSLAIILRRTPGGGQIPIRMDLNRALRDPRERILIQPGDVVLLQETMGEAIVRYATAIFSFQFTGRVINRQDAQGVTNAVLP